MTSGSKKILEERLTAFEGMKAIMEKIDRGEHLSVEERSDFDARNRRITELDADLRTAREAEELASKLRRDTESAPAPVVINPEARAANAFSHYLRTGDISEYRAMGTGGMNTTSPGTGSTSGSLTPGFLVPPGWWQRLQVALKVYGGIANDFQQLETESGQPLMWATVNPTSLVGSLIAENTTITGQDYTFGQGTLSAYMYTSGVQLVSFQLANDSAFDIDGFVSDRVGESLGRAVAAVAISGSGSSAPLGIITALSGQGSTSGNGGFVQLSSGAPIYVGGTTTTTEVAANTLSVNSLRKLIAQVDPAYRAQGAKFYMNDAQLLGTRGLNDANGRPLVNLQDGVTPGVPTSIWGYEVVVDNNIPNITSVATAGGIVGGPVFGHLPSAMVQRRVKDVSLMRLDERYADALQVGYIGYMRFDIRSNDLRAAATVATIQSAT